MSYQFNVATPTEVVKYFTADEEEREIFIYICLLFLVVISSLLLFLEPLGVTSQDSFHVFGMPIVDIVPEKEMLCWSAIFFLGVLYRTYGKLLIARKYIKISRDLCNTKRTNVYIRVNIKHLDFPTRFL